MKEESAGRVISATATDLQNNFGKYLKVIMNGGEVIVVRNGKEVGRMIPKESAVSFLTDSLMGVLGEEEDWQEAREEYLKEKYEITD